MGNLMTMGACLSEQQKRMSNSIQAAHRVADSYMRYAEQNNTSAYEQGVTAQLLCNFAEKHRSYDEGVKAFGRVSDAAFGTSFQDGATHEGSFGPWVMDVWPLVVAWYPEFPLKELISVQEMEKPLAWMFFSTLKAGTDKAPTVYGDVVETPLGMRKIKGQYPTGEVFGEVIPADQIQSDETTATTKYAMLTHYPLNLTNDYTEKLKVTVNAETTTADTTDPDTGEVIPGTTTTTSNSYGYHSMSGKTVYFKAWGDETNTKVDGIELDIETGLLTIDSTVFTTFTADVTNIEFNYVFNLDYATANNIPKVKEEVEKIEMIARERALQLEWSLFSEYLKKTQFGQDIQQDNLKRVLDLMYQFQVRYILDDMYNNAEGIGDGGVKGADKTIPVLANGYYSIDVKVQKLLQSLNETANQIEIESGRMAGNRLVVGRDVKAFLESLPNTYYTANDDNKGFSSPREIGSIAGFKVFFDPYIEGNKGFMTYKGDEWYDAAYYMGMYMPLTTTDTVVLGVSAKMSFVSMEAYKYHKKNCVIKLAFDFNGNTTNIINNGTTNITIGG